MTSERLYALGIELMDRAVAEADAAKRISKAHAFIYRDGLIIALPRPHTAAQPHACSAAYRQTSRENG